MGAGEDGRDEQHGGEGIAEDGGNVVWRGDEEEGGAEGEEDLLFDEISGCGLWELG